MIKISIWHCPECDVPMYSMLPCKECGTAYTPTWRCDRCNKTAVGGMCECGRSRKSSLQTQAFEAYMSEEEDGRGTNMSRIEKFAHGYAIKKMIPHHLIEDAISEAFIRLYNNIHRYSPTLGKFSTWGIAFVKNELRIIARADSRRGNRIAFSFDDTPPDSDNPIGESYPIEGNTLDASIFIDEEEREELYRRMLRVARIALGEYRDDNGNPQQLYDACVQAFKESENGVGWASRAARITGLTPAAISNRKMTARMIWQDENQMRHLSSQSGGLSS